LISERLRGNYDGITVLGISVQAGVVKTRTYMILEVVMPVTLKNDSSAVKMEVTNSIDTFVPIYRT
jgi:hypothetical protein